MCTYVAKMTILNMTSIMEQCMQKGAVSNQHTQKKTAIYGTSNQEPEQTFHYCVGMYSGEIALDCFPCENAIKCS